MQTLVVSVSSLVNSFIIWAMAKDPGRIMAGGVADVDERVSANTLYTPRAWVDRRHPLVVHGDRTAPCKHHETRASKRLYIVAKGIRRRFLRMPPKHSTLPTWLTWTYVAKHVAEGAFQAIGALFIYALAIWALLMGVFGASNSATVQKAVMMKTGGILGGGAGSTSDGLASAPGTQAGPSVGAGREENATPLQQQQAH